MSVRVAKSHIRGKGLFATAAFSKGERIMRMSGARVSNAEMSRLIRARKYRYDDPFEIGRGRYIALDPVPIAANHSCNPNAGIRGTDELIAIRAIRPGDEITYDYSTTVGDTAEDELPWTMRCRCGAQRCRKSIGNWRTLPKARLHAYLRLDALPSFIKRLSARAKVSP